MPTYVNPDKCDGCKGLERTACQYICPNDLMHLDKSLEKALNIEPDQCWECYSCVKICPQQAIAVRHYADFAPLGGSVIPLMGTDSIMWTIKFRDGRVKRYKFKTRTTPEGSIEPFEGLPPVSPGELTSPNLYSETGKTLPVPA